MPRLRALTSWADRKAGDEFEATEADARLLCAIDALGGQKARIVDRAMSPAPPAETRHAEAESQKQSEPTKSEKRRYMRRDLQAQN